MLTSVSRQSPSSPTAPTGWAQASLGAPAPQPSPSKSVYQARSRDRPSMVRLWIWISEVAPEDTMTRSIGWLRSSVLAKVRTRLSPTALFTTTWSPPVPLTVKSKETGTTKLRELPLWSTPTVTTSPSSVPLWLEGHPFVCHSASTTVVPSDRPILKALADTGMVRSMVTVASSWPPGKLFAGATRSRYRISSGRMPLVYSSVVPLRVLGLEAGLVARPLARLSARSAPS